MKNAYMLAVLTGLVVFPGVAFAEMLSGTITQIDMAGGKITLVRNDTKESITVSIKDQQSLSGIMTGNSIMLDARKKLLGGYEAQAVSPLPQEAAMVQTDPAPVPADSAVTPVP